MAGCQVVSVVIGEVLVVLWGVLLVIEEVLVALS